MRELLGSWLPKVNSPDRRGWEWFYLYSLPYQNVRTFTEGGREGRPSTVAWHVASRRLAERTHDGLIRIWDVDREQTTLILRGPPPADQFWGTRSLAWNPDGKTLAVGCIDGTVHVWDTGSGHELKVLAGLKAPVNSVAFSSDGARVAAWATDGAIKLWNAGTGASSADVLHPGNACAGAWSPDDKYLATGRVDGTVTVSGTRAGDKIVVLKGHVDLIYDLAWSRRQRSTRLVERRFHRERLGDCVAKSCTRPATALPWHHVGRVGPRRAATGDGQPGSDHQDLACVGRARGRDSSWSCQWHHVTLVGTGRVAGLRRE